MREVDLELQPTSTSLGPGERLTLVVDTVDRRLASDAVPGTTVTLRSSPAAPAVLPVPLG